MPEHCAISDKAVPMICMRAGAFIRRTIAAWRPGHSINLPHQIARSPTEIVVVGH